MTENNKRASIKIIEAKRPNKPHIINPLTMGDAMKKMNLYYVPSLVDPDLTPEEMLRKHQERLEYNGSFRDGYIFRQFVLAAETLEQQEQLYIAIDDKVPYDEKPKALQEIWDEMLVKKRPTYMFATVTRAARIDTFTFLPVWQILKRNDETEDNTFVVRVGVPAEEVGIEHELPYVVFSAAHMQEAREFAYKLFLKMRETEESFLREFLKVGANRVQLASHLIYLSRVLQFGEEGSENDDAKVIYYLGQDVITLQRVDPHNGYLLTVHKRVPNPDGNGFAHREYQFFFEIEPPIKAVLATEFYRRTMRLSSIPYFPSRGVDAVMPAMLGYYRFKTANQYSATNVTLGKKLGAPSAEIYEFLSDKGTAVTVVVPQREENELVEGDTPFAYVFSGTAKRLAEALKWKDLKAEKQWLSDHAPRNVNPDDIESSIAPIGEIYVKEDDGQVVRIKRDKNGKRTRSEKRRFSVDIIDSNATIAAMGMELSD